MWYELLTCAIEPSPNATRRDTERRGVESLLRRRLGSGVELAHTPQGAPLLVGLKLHVSISHCRDMVVVALSDNGVGVDVETWREQLPKVAPRVFSTDEVMWAGSSRERLLRLWTAKEAIYKLALTPGLDFVRDIVCEAFGNQITKATCYINGSGRRVEIATPTANAERVVTVARFAP